MTQVVVESSMEHFPLNFLFLIGAVNPATKTVFGGQFHWGGVLLKSNVRFQRSPQVVWKSTEEYKGIRWLYCETYKSSSYESRA